MLLRRTKFYAGLWRKEKEREIMEYTIDDLLIYAKNRKASDLHVTAGIQAKCRVDGILEQITKEPLTANDTEELIRPMMNDKLMKTFIENGEVDFSYQIKDVGRFRVNVFRQRGAFATVLRLVNSVIPLPDSLGVPPSVVELTKRKRGLVLVTGPTGSGKSTTLASLIDVINRTREEHIITLEDPIEYLHNHKRSIVNQREIGFDTMNYANGVRAALREDPDVILVGEMRDLDTISTAITAAETGHLVFSTLHTIGAAPTIDRVIDVFPPHQQDQIRVQLASVLLAVVSQSLIPLASGHGRVAAFEIMHANPAIRNLIRENKTHQIESIMQTSRNIGMQTMDDCIFKLYMDGKIDSEQALEFAQKPEVLGKKLF